MNENNGTHRILVVDDEQVVRQSCRKILAMEGYHVETAENGMIGLELFKKRRNFAVALIDLKMPGGMDGIELTKKLHEEDEDTILLLITGYATIETAVEVTKKGAYGYIPKPFTPDELLLPVKQGIERRSLLIEARRLREERERRLLEVAFERSKSNTIIKCMTDGVLVINCEGRIVLQNAAAARMFMGHISQLKSSFLLNALDCADMNTLLTNLRDAVSGPVIVSKEIVLGQCTYMVNVSPVIDELSGETAGIVAVFRDITSLKNLESAKSMFVSMVAHEVKSPLAAAEGYLNLILRGQVKENPEKEREILQRSLLRIKTLRTMVSELLNLTAMETGHFTFRRARVDIKKLVSEAVESYREQAQEKQITLSMTCGGNSELEQVLADKEAMYIVFTNLIDNAIKYTPDKGHVWVHAEQNGLYVKVKVKDDGIGMEPDEKERVFDEFFRAKNEYTAHVLGTGLGLSLVRRLLDMHHGTITVETTPSKGSEFTVSIPIEG